MKRTILYLFFVIGSANLFAQDIFHTQLFTADMALKYRNEIGLSDQQVSDIKKIYQNQITEFNSLKWDLDVELEALKKLLKGAKVDEKATLAQMEKVMGMEDRLKRLKLTMLIQIKNKLTLEQQEKLKKVQTESEILSSDLITSLSENPRVLLKIDGMNSIEKQPLYIIKDSNGERTVPSVEDVDTTEIESVEVLKGESATEVYGKKGANGVVIIKMKK
ncbi:MAG: TonB-dependent receptor plug domain-containing protein [Cyclobacteriaceae bacterium]|nr:TonB-dependent receptor plug domain-containing protein [Cyclobacteriaceae bacterium]